MSDATASTDERQIHEATKDVIDRLAEFDNETRRRVFRRAMGFFELDLFPSSDPVRRSQTEEETLPAQRRVMNGTEPRFAERSELPPKDFMFQKQPRTDIERIACLAYYL